MNPQSAVNMWATAFCLTGVLIVSTSAAPTAKPTPKPCDTPKQWEGSAWALDEETGMAKFIVMSYDEENKRVRSSVATINGRFER